MFRPYMWAIFRLIFNLQVSYTRCVGCLSVHWVGGKTSRSPHPTPNTLKEHPMYLV